jgi:hypothetical protein
MNSKLLRRHAKHKRGINIRAGGFQYGLRKRYYAAWQRKFLGRLMSLLKLIFGRAASGAITGLVFTTILTANASAVTVVLNPSDGYSYQVEPGATISSENLRAPGAGALVGTGLMFAVPSVSQTFYPTTRLVNGFPTNYFGLLGSVDKIVVEVPSSHDYYFLSPLSILRAGTTCADANGGASCAAAGNFASFNLVPATLKETHVNVVVTLNPSNGYSYQVEPGATITSANDGGPGTGGLAGTGVTFSAEGSAFYSTATLRSGFPFSPPSLLGNDKEISALVALSGDNYYLTLLSLLRGHFGCQDADNGASCAAADNYTSFRLVGDFFTYTETATTPLPSTWLMLLTGFVGLGFFAYRGTKKRTAALAAA